MSSTRQRLGRRSAQANRTRLITRHKLDLALIRGPDIDPAVEMSWSSSTRRSGSSVNGGGPDGLGWGGTSRNAPSTDLGTSLRPPPTTLVPTSEPWRPVHVDGWGGYDTASSAFTTHASVWGSDARRPWLNSYGDSYGEDGWGAQVAESPNRPLDSLAPTRDHLAPPQIRVNDEPAYDLFSASVSMCPVPAPRPIGSARRGESLAPGFVSTSTGSPSEDDFPPAASQYGGGERGAWCQTTVSSLSPSTPGKSVRRD